MKLTFIALFLLGIFVSCSKNELARETLKFTKDWKFILADSSE